jgi:muramidase (phage lysozyme)
MPSAQQYLELIKNSPNLQKFLQTIGWAEGADYQKGFSGRFIPSLDWHPYNKCQFANVGNGWRDTGGNCNAGTRTTSAAGKYQFERGTWESAARALGLQNFGPQSQDIAAVYLIDKAGALNDVLKGNAPSAVNKLKPVWEGFTTRPLQNIVNYFDGVTNGITRGNASGAQTISASDDFSKYIGKTVIGDKNRYLIAFVILVLIFIFAFN